MQVKDNYYTLNQRGKKFNTACISKKALKYRLLYKFPILPRCKYDSFRKLIGNPLLLGRAYRTAVASVYSLLYANPLAS